MKYFTIQELTYSATAEKNNIENMPNETQLMNLIALTENVLDPARELLCEPIIVNSAFRCPALNKKVGGVKNSQHTKGEAADITCSDNKKLFSTIKENIIFDQLIWEQGGRWIHISYVKNGQNRKQILYT